MLIPGLCLGPSLNGRVPVSGLMIKRSMEGNLVGVPKISFPMVDVRNVGQAHLLALEKGEVVNGKKFLVVEGSYWFVDLNIMLKNEFNKFGYSITTKTIPKFFLKVISIWNNFVKYYLSYLNSKFIIDNTQSIKCLGVKYSRIDECLIEQAYDLIREKHIKNKILFLLDKNDPLVINESMKKR